MTDVIPMGQQPAQAGASGTTPALRSTISTPIHATMPAGITSDVVPSTRDSRGPHPVVEPDVTVASVASDTSPPCESSQTSPAPRAGIRAEKGTLARRPAADDTLPYETVENTMADIFDYLAYQPDQE